MYITRAYVDFITEQYSLQYLDWGTLDDTVHSGRYLVYLITQISHKPTPTHFLVRRKLPSIPAPLATAPLSAAAQ